MKEIRGLDQSLVIIRRLDSGDFMLRIIEDLRPSRVALESDRVMATAIVSDKQMAQLFVAAATDRQTK